MEYKHYYVYLHRRKDNNEVFYVGKGCNKRAWLSQGRNVHWRCIAENYGFTVEIIESKLTSDDAIELEAETIKFYRDCKHDLCNLTHGGGNTTFASSETRKKVSAARTGKKASEATKEKLSVLNKGVPKSEESKLLAKRGRRLSIIKERRTKKKSVLCSNSKVFESITAATLWCRENGYPKASKSCIVGCCKGKTKSAYSFTWEYVIIKTQPVITAPIICNNYLVKWVDRSGVTEYSTNLMSVKDVWEIFRWRTTRRTCRQATIEHKSGSVLLSWYNLLCK
jgi:hypothetical protein